MSRLTRDGTAEPSRETKFSGTHGDRGVFIFSVQLTTSRIGGLTRLIHTLLYVITIHTYIHTYSSPRHYTVDPMLFPSGNPFICHEEVLYLQPLIPPKRFDIFLPSLGMLRRIPPKRFDIFSPLTGGCSEGLGAFCFFFKHVLNTRTECMH